MAFIDWSDHEEMLGLLIEYAADEKADSIGDPERTRFLTELLRELRGVESSSADEVLRMLRQIADSQPHEFIDDPVFTHLQDCIEELIRIRSCESSPSA